MVRFRPMSATGRGTVRRTPEPWRARMWRRAWCNEAGGTHVQDNDER
jgi:hypothetical protein